MKLWYLGGTLCVTSQLLLTTPLLTASPQNTNSSQSTKNSTTSNESSQTAKEITRLATRLLQHVDQARHALSSNEKQPALNHINQALADRNQLATFAKSKGLPLVVPLYTEFDESSTLGPLMASRKSNQAPNTKNTPNAYTPITVDQASGGFTSIGLDVDKAKARLEAAKSAIDNGNNQAASDSLSAVETDLVMSSEQTSFPLLAARENLGIGESAVKAGHFKEAAAALKEASTDLNTFAGTNPAKHADDAKNLSKTIDSYSQQLSQNHNGAASKIDTWWFEVDNWFDHPAKSL
jgi:hypothetical protein